MNHGLLRARNRGWDGRGASRRAGRGLGGPQSLLGSSSRVSLCHSHGMTAARLPADLLRLGGFAPLEPFGQIFVRGAPVGMEEGEVGWGQPLGYPCTSIRISPPLDARPHSTSPPLLRTQLHVHAEPNPHGGGLIIHILPNSGTSF